MLASGTRNPSAAAVGMDPIRGHERSALLAQKVKAAKSVRLTCFEVALRSCCTIMCSPLCFLGVGWVQVNANTAAAFFRFGKLERVRGEGRGERHAAARGAARGARNPPPPPLLPLPRAGH